MLPPFTSDWLFDIVTVSVTSCLGDLAQVGTLASFCFSPGMQPFATSEPAAAPFAMGEKCRLCGRLPFTIGE